MLHLRRAIACAALLLDPCVAIGQSYYDPPRSSSHARIPGYGTLDAYDRNSSSHAKRSPAATWLRHRIDSYRPQARSRPDHSYRGCYGRDCNGD